MERSRALQFTRQNTGKRLTDSGDYYGRAYDSPPPPEGKLVYIFPKAYGLYDCAISVTEMLVQCCDESDALNELWKAFLEEEDDSNPWEILVESFLTGLGYTPCGRRNNACNDENDFDQAFVYQLWETVDATGDDLYYHRKDDGGHGDGGALPQRLVLFQIHTGCDVRSGYSDPLFVTGSFGEYSLPVYSNRIAFGLGTVRNEPYTRADLAAEVESTVKLMDQYGGSQGCTAYFLESRGYAFVKAEPAEGRFIVKRNGVKYYAWPESGLLY